VGSGLIGETDDSNGVGNGETEGGSGVDSGRTPLENVGRAGEAEGKTEGETDGAQAEKKITEKTVHKDRKSSLVAAPMGGKQATGRKACVAENFIRERSKSNILKTYCCGV
jgi:hypothetical protein